MLNRLPRQMPSLSMMLDDLNRPNPAALAKSLDVHVRTVNRWIEADNAPRAVMLSIFWLTRWGQGAVNCDAHNAATMYAGYVGGLKREIEKLKTQLEHAGRIGDFGAANDPADSIRGPGPVSRPLEFPPIEFPTGSGDPDASELSSLKRSTAR